MRRPGSAGIRLVVATAASVSVIALLAGCTASSPTAAVSPTPTPTITNAPQATVAPPTLNPHGTALQNLAYFESVLHPLLDTAPTTPGRTIIDTLVAAGFEKSSMELTPDKTSVGLQADNVEFSIRMNGTCLVGQTGNVGFHAMAAPMLATGLCLVGKTRPIDW